MIMVNLRFFVETADCETDGYQSSSGLQDPLEAGSFNTTPPTTHTDTPAVNGLAIPALRFPSVSERVSERESGRPLNEELVLSKGKRGALRDFQDFYDTVWCRDKVNKTFYNQVDKTLRSEGGNKNHI